MHNLLYLDTARLGQMSLEARRASIDFARFANEQGCTLYFTRLLTKGFSSWPVWLQKSYPGLANWEGVRAFKQRLQLFVNADCHSIVFFASRGASVMKVAAKSLAATCRKVLTTDNCWPPYRAILDRELHVTGCKSLTLPVKRLSLHSETTLPDLVNYVATKFVQQNCDGLFLPLIDNFGIRLPVDEIVREIRTRTKLKFVAVDAAQAIGQIPLNFRESNFDFVVAGAHKWLRAFYTLGIGFACNAKTESQMNRAMRLWQNNGSLDDPILRFSNELESGETTQFGETVQVAPLFVASGALAAKWKPPNESKAIAEANRERFAAIAELARWQLIEPKLTALKSRIVLAKVGSGVDSLAIDDVFLDSRIAATTYPKGIVRISLPDELLGKCEIQQLLRAMIKISAAGKVRRKLEIST